MSKTITIDTPGPERVTDSQGRFVWEASDHAEPLPGSVALTNGEWGTAWQRYFNDGMWHRVGGGRARSWADLLTERNLMLAYDAQERG